MSFSGIKQMDNNIVFVSGANRGIGLEFVRQLARRGDQVIGGYRNAATSGELLGMADERENVHALPVEVTDRQSINNLKNFIADRYARLDILINNAGISIKYFASFGEIEPDDIMENVRVNVIGPFLVGNILRPLLAQSKNPRLINITSHMGSVSHSRGGATPYRISKAALNMLSRNQSLEYREDHIITIALHPGWVRTAMGGPDAPLKPKLAVANMLKIIDNLSEDQNGSFLSHDGTLLNY